MTGLLTVVGLGPGGPAHRTRAAEDAVRDAQVVLGYHAYLAACADLTGPHQSVVPSGIGAEQQRAGDAVRAAAGGARVALVSSGDAGIYGMASLALTTATALPPTRRPAVRVVPGITAAIAAGALLGAPLARDFACLTLSDLLAPWEAVETRLRAVAAADLVLALYNPRSQGRSWQLHRARDVLAEYRPGDTPVGLVTDAGRDGERVELVTLATLDPARAGMHTVVIVGAADTSRLGTWLVTARSLGARS
ncbi:MAG: precorrin-3B C(17)-methyltransferase [Pseudonocardiales bacterium]|nr:precorrin-3B C(17)-methyltransferase [Pseudonocardiales bacterium]MBV9729754.1 precorrin-3B C(17)-methyltransferase [Pseudonocardiales bacterium]